MHIAELIKPLIRDVPDFPKPGILFKDITPLLQHADVLQQTIQALVEPFRAQAVSCVAGMEARGFIFGALAAQALGVGFIPLRKPGKLPYQTQSLTYDLEYGSATLHVHVDAVTRADRVLVVDDLIATGGTTQATCALLEKLGARIAGCAFVVELDFLNGRAQLAPHTVHSLIHY